MIQAPLPKPIEMPKAKPAAEKRDLSHVSEKSNAPKAKALKEEKVSAKKEFDKELETSMSEDSEVKPVEVSAEQALELPSSLVQPSGSVDTTSPKVFDPSVTKDVEKLIQPKTTEVPALTDAQVLEIANAEVPAEMKGELAQAMMKTPQVGGRSPAIEFAKAEIDPQLMSNEDFVAQKNAVMKKPVNNVYGMKAVPAQQQKEALIENGLKQNQVIQESAPVDNTSVNSQQFILGLQTEVKGSQASETQAPAKVFDMNNIKSSQPNEIMNQITDYVVQAKAAKEPTVNMRVNHDELGMIDITVSRAGMNQDAIAVNIGTHSMDGKNFFQQNSKDLMSHLSNAGLNVSDLKVETPTQTAKNDFDFGSQSGRNGQQQGSERQFGSEQNQRRHDSERRQDLWRLLNKEAA